MYSIQHIDFKILHFIFLLFILHVVSTKCVFSHQSETKNLTNKYFKTLRKIKQRKMYDIHSHRLKEKHGFREKRGCLSNMMHRLQRKMLDHLQVDKVRDKLSICFTVELDRKMSRMPYLFALTTAGYMYM